MSIGDLEWVIISPILEAVKVKVFWKKKLLNDLIGDVIVDEGLLHWLVCMSS